VVEDELALRILVKEILEGHGYKVFEAASGIEAWEKWQKLRAEIDLVLTDELMPGGMNGRELAAKIKSVEASIKVILTSGYGGELADGGGNLRDGFHFLQKPYHPVKLLRALRECLDTR
jgi:CheY-like chemotaxis protein